MSSNRYYDGSILNRELGANNMGDTAARNMRNNGPIHTSSFSIGTQGQGMVTFQNHMLKNINIMRRDICLKLTVVYVDLFSSPSPINNDEQYT